MAHGQELKVELRRLYVFEQFDLQMSAEKVGVAISTARRWKQAAEKSGDDWDRMRDVNSIAGGKVEDVAKGILTRYLINTSNILQEIEDNDKLNVVERAQLLTNLGDSFTKMTAASKKLVPSVTKQAAGTEMIIEFTEYVKKHKPQILADVLDLMEGFSVHLIEKFEE